MEAETYSVTAAAEIAGVPRGTLAAWRSRGDAPASAWGVHDLLNLGVLADLLRGGLTLEAGQALAWRIRPEDWAKAEERGIGRWMMSATRDDNGVWAVGFGKPGHLASPPRCTVIIDLTEIAAKIRRRAADYAPAETGRNRQHATLEADRSVNA